MKAHERTLFLVASPLALADYGGRKDLVTVKIMSSDAELPAARVEMFKKIDVSTSQHEKNRRPNGSTPSRPRVEEN